MNEDKNKQETEKFHQRQNISQIAKLTNVSVRTLHYYDEIGLLKPSEVDQENGYRYYDSEAMERLQQILFYKELDFPLKEIKNIMNTKGYNKNEALQNQRNLLDLKRRRLDKLIHLLDANLRGEKDMSFKQFDKAEIEEAKNKYAQEAKEKWGETDAYKESVEKHKDFSDEEWADSMGELDRLLKCFSEYIGTAPESEEVQDLVEQWKLWISRDHYKCTNEILAGLGEMYVCDERFTKNMDKYGEGTTKLISEAIQVYCGI